MIVHDIQSEWRHGAAVVTARVATRHEPMQQIWFRITGLQHAPDSAAEAVAAGLLVPGMLAGEDVEVHGAVGWTLARNLEAAGDVLSAWHPRLRPVDVLADQFTRPGRHSHRSSTRACFFTAGLNSWYSVLMHRAVITHLVVVRGLGATYDETGAWRDMVAKTRRIADRLGFSVVTCETNLRIVAEVLGRFRALPGEDIWRKYLCGSALGAVGLLLQHEIGEAIVAATQSYRRLRPSGSSPLLDSCWSSDRIRIVHDGCEATRMDKTRVVASSGLALASLHVCDHEFTNCGCCDKCLTTELALCAIGMRESSPSDRFMVASNPMTPDSRFTAQDSCRPIALPSRVVTERYEAASALPGLPV